MKQNIPGENTILLRGRLMEAPILSHQNHEHQFFLFPLEVYRLSGAADRINVVSSGAVLVPLGPLQPGQRVAVQGEVRTYNNRSGTGPKLIISVFARSIVSTEEEDENRLHLSGVLCKPPSLRATPLGRSICDLTLAVNRRYGRADYLPCIAWGSVAHRCGNMKVGDPVSLEGRLQSRAYTKVLDDRTEERTAFEISVMNILEPE